MQDKTPITTAMLNDVVRPGVQREYRFHPERMWRFDYAWEDIKLAVELEGGIYMGKGQRCRSCQQPKGGAHRAVSGILRDIEKYNAATELGWRILRFPPDRFDPDRGQVGATLTLIKNTVNRILATAKRAEEYP